MTLKRALIVLCCTTSWTLHAATLAEEIENIQSTYQAMNDLSADFIQETYVTALEKTLRRTGIFRYKRGGKLRIEYTSPDLRFYVSDGKTLWIYDPEDPASMTVESLSEKTVPKEALSFLAGFGQLQKEFTVSPSTAFASAPEGAVALHLIPHAKKAPYKTLDALFGTSHIMSELISHNASGNDTHYRFTRIRQNTQLSDTLFTVEEKAAHK